MGMSRVMFVFDGAIYAVKSFVVKQPFTNSTFQLITLKSCVQEIATRQYYWMAAYACGAKHS